MPDYQNYLVAEDAVTGNNVQQSTLRYVRHVVPLALEVIVANVTYLPQCYARLKQPLSLDSVDNHRDFLLLTLSSVFIGVGQALWFCQK